MTEDANIQLLEEGEKVTRIQQDDGVDEIRQKRLAYFESILKQQKFYEDHGKSHVNEFDLTQSCGENVKQLNKSSPGVSPDACLAVKEEKDQLNADANKTIMIKRKLRDQEYMERNVTVLNGRDIMNGTSKQSEKDAILHLNQHMPSAFKEYDTDKYQNQAAFKTAENFERNFGQSKQKDTFFADEKPLVSDSPRGIHSGWSASYVEHVKSKQFENIDELFLKKNGQERILSHKSRLKDSVTESQEVEAIPLFQKSVDLSELGLCTHRPESDRFTDEQRVDDPVNLLDDIMSEELRNALGEEKYREFLAKSMKDLSELQKERNSDRSSSRKDKSHSSHKGEKTTDKEKLTGKSSVQLQTSPARKLEIRETAKMNLQSKSDLNKSKSLQTKEKFEKKEVSHPVKERDKEDGNGDTHHDSLSKDSPRPKLNRPKFSPPSIWQNSMEWSQSGSDGRKDGSLTPVTPTQTGYLRNYEQITVPRNVSFSSDEIYQQAYGMNVYGGLYSGAGIPISPHSPHPYMSNHFFHPGGVPFSPMGPSNVYMNPMTPTATNTVMNPQFMFNQYSMNVSHSVRESADKGYFPIMNAFNGDSSSPIPVPRPPNKSYPGEKLTPNEKHQGDANGMFFATHPPTPRSEQLNSFQGQMFPYPVMVPVLIPHPPVQPQTGAKDLARNQPVQPQTGAKDSADIKPLQPQTGAKESTHIQSVQTQTSTKDIAHIQSVQSFGARIELVSQVESLEQQQNCPLSLPAENSVNLYVLKQEKSEEDSSSDDVEEEEIIPHPPKEKKMLKTRSPRRTQHTEDQVKWNSDSKRHIEGIRQHHEQRRQQQVEEKLTEEQILEKQRKFAKASLKRYFKSLESMYKPGRRHFSPPTPLSVASNTDDENDGRDEDYPEIVFGLDENGDNDASDNEAGIAGDNKDDNVDALDNEIGIAGDTNNADDADDVAIETGADSDSGGVTLVQSAVTGASIKAGGITERLNKLGIDTSLLKHNENGIKDQTGETSDKKSVKKPKLVILCPECQGINKSYMTWCCHCGENIMGIDPVLVRKNRKGVIKIMPAIVNGTSDRNPQCGTQEVVKTQRGNDQNIKSKLDNQQIGMDNYAKSEECYAKSRSVKPESNIGDNHKDHPENTDSQEMEAKQNGLDFSMQKIAGKTRALIEKFQNVSHSAAEDMDRSPAKLNSPGKVTLMKHSKGVDETSIIDCVEDSDSAKCQQNITSWAFHMKPCRSHSEQKDVKDSVENGPMGHSSTSLSYNKDKIMSSVVDLGVKEHRDGDVSPIDISLDDTSCFLLKQNTLKSTQSSQDVANLSLQNSEVAVPIPVKTAAKVPIIKDLDNSVLDQSQQGKISFSSPSSMEPRPSLSRTNQHDDSVNITVSRHDVHVSPVKSDGRDSGRPSSEDRSPPHNFQRTEKEITEICEHISDPVIRGFIKSYFIRKKQAVEAQGVGTTTGPDLMKSGMQSHEAMEKAIPVIPEAIAGAFVNELKGLPNELALELQHSFDFSQASSVDLTQVSSMPNGQCATQNAGKKEGHKKAHKKRSHAGAIDVEVFGYEESRQSRNSSRGLKLVPVLNLRGSSDDESMSEHSAAPYQPPVKPEEDQDDGEWETLFEPAIEENEPGNIETIEEVQEEVDVSDEPFLAQIISHSPGKKKKQGKREARGQGRGSPVNSKVRQSVEAPGYQRKWARSSIAWSSFNSGELNTKSTLRASTENLERLSSDPKMKATGENASGPHSARASSSPRPPLPKQKSRPLSADLKKRKQQRYRPVSARRLDSVEVIEDKGPADVIETVEHRLPQSELWEKIYEMMASPKSTYSKYLQMTPRIQEGSVSVWQCLPDEILLHILAYLSQTELVRCAQVCHQFYRVAMDETLWKHITVKKRLLDDDCLKHIAKHHPTSLALIQCQGDTVSAKGLRDLFRESANDLKELNFSYCSRGALTGDSILLHAAARCQNLTHIDASWSNVTDSGIIAISNGCKRLESTCINGCQGISNEGFETMIKKHGGSLRVLEMFGCFGITARAITTLSNNCTSLVSLHLGQCYKLTDSCISQLSASLGRVETLDLRGCKQIKDNCIRRVVKNCPRLKSLVLANCPNITDVSMLEISTYLTDIRSIDVCGCKNVTDNSVRALANSCMNLRHVDISSSGCTHRSVSLIASFCGQRLECLKLNFLCDVTEACIIKLIKNCKRLKMLHLYGCTNIRNLDKIREDNPGLTIES
ncbi:hypothetical protein CHS0354_020143 [Potamilus streckersoni]|uniref:F-box domain-containing protein n=1 Tax=Potamilus streckersoni TaxID=2493646 RepID=A0AAE0S4X1_9BIVA|nr:hypothetical protein CHS0354_020143 [Potamilus streckersoni]